MVAAVLDESEHMRSMFAATSSGSNAPSSAIRRPMNLGALLIEFLRLYVPIYQYSLYLSCFTLHIDQSNYTHTDMPSVLILRNMVSHFVVLCQTNVPRSF